MTHKTEESTVHIRNCSLLKKEETIQNQEKKRHTG